jgi:hypothetical protein
MSVQYFWKALKAFSSKDLYKLQEWHPGDLEDYSEMISENYCSINQPYFRFLGIFLVTGLSFVWNLNYKLEDIYLCFEFLPFHLGLAAVIKTEAFRGSEIAICFVTFVQGGWWECNKLAPGYEVKIMNNKEGHCIM